MSGLFLYPAGYPVSFAGYPIRFHLPDIRLIGYRISGSGIHKILDIVTNGNENCLNPKNWKKLKETKEELEETKEELEETKEELEETKKVLEETIEELEETKEALEETKEELEETKEEL